MSFKKK